MSGNVRARRPASPPPGASHALPTTSQRFPHARQDHLDADSRRAAASQGLAPGRVKAYPLGGLHIESGEWKLLLAILAVAFFVRLFRLSKPSSVVFDEVHFGKFASKYIKTQFFVDVHPPLAKLLITLAAFVFGYDGNFEFKDIGKPYDDVPYVAMRLVPALLGVATIPLSYLTLRGLDCRATTALLASLFITFENGMVTQSRYILLDSPLIFFTALTIFFWVGFCNEDKHEPFTESWWGWLFMSGLSLGAVASCKWVGLFTVATVGLSTIRQLWLLLGDLRVSPRVWLRHFVARAFCLILVPVLFYMGMFQIHFMILGSSGDGDGFMSSEFQHTLGGRGMADTFADIAIGSQITLRHVNTQGGYLHSHAHNYPGGSKQQQITLYPHRDGNNDWTIYNATWEKGDGGLTYITDKMRIKLQHISTQKHLHSHDVRPPVSDVEFQNEVSAYGMPGFAGDANDDWWVEIVSGDKRDRESAKRLRTLRTTFRLRHALTGCYLFSHKIKLPEWGFEQQEVTCNKNAVMANSLWKIETASHPLLPEDAPKVNYRLPGFLAKFLELQQVMWTTNAGLTDRHTFDSRPESWPRLRRGINFWVKDHRQIYLIGNAMVWWLSTLAVLAYIAVRGFLILRAKRGFRDFDSTKVVKYDGLCGFLFLGWFLHYFPFYIMARQLFLHHYLPALYFAILLFAGVFDLVTSTLRPRVRLQIAGVLILLAVWNFWHFSPLAYGSEWTRGQCTSSKWLKTWDFSCNEFPETYAEYGGIAAATPHTPPVVTTGQGAPAADAEAETTSLYVMKPEPGHDIFGGAPPDVRSKGGPPPPVVDEDKIISEVMQTTAAAEESASAQAQVESSEAVSVAETSPAASAESADGASSASESASTEADAEAEPVLAKPAGPLGEAEVEADKVAQELYPDAVQK
ncbi:glycosyltransferase family 39 protein [Mycena maculata]|uniref:Dolichyl-phosphate-mannose--protein mannosyltransferase n=1 Tax=Mycena maculata TaxID=230809 RepID=A0AAD7HI88_9AGAR|nr:glycosyltransferase family 39 protein [Mycena maculata]